MTASFTSATDYEALRQARMSQPIACTMMHVPLRIIDVMRRAEQVFPEQEVISRHGPGRILRQTYAEIGVQARRLSAALQARGVKPGMRVATLMWNHGAHLAAYYAVPGAQAVLHTLNPRLSAEELAYIIADAGDAAVLVDDDLLPLWQQVEQLVKVPLVIVHALGEQPTLAAQQSGHSLWANVIAATDPQSEWDHEVIDENTPVSICYTSGTTGRPKGVVYSHRSVLLHALALATPDALRVSGRDSILTITPMFHVNAWSMPYTGLMLGAKLVLSGPRPTPAELADLMQNERVNKALGVPTIWNDFLNEVEKSPGRWTFVPQALICSGGAAPPAEMFRRFDRLDMYLQTGWGMTELSPMGSQTWIKAQMDADLSDEQRLALRTSNGLPLPFVEMRHVDEDGKIQPWDGDSVGELQVRSPWATQSYIGHPEPISACSEDGWLKTGDIVLFTRNGYLRLVDRKKDLVKSGGEWISTTDMENALHDHPCVAEAAVIAVSDERWGERPLAVVALRASGSIDATAIQAHLLKRFPKWMVPEQVEFMESLPKTSVGKLNKVALRKQFH